MIYFIDSNRTHCIDIFPCWGCVCRRWSQTDHDSGLFQGKRGEHSPATTQNREASTNQTWSVEWIVHVFDPAGCWNQANVLQLGWWALTPASSQAVSLALAPEGRAPGCKGPVADSLMPRWLTQSAGCASKWVGAWRQATTNTATAARSPFPPTPVECVGEWDGWGYFLDMSMSKVYFLTPPTTPVPSVREWWLPSH